MNKKYLETRVCVICGKERLVQKDSSHKTELCRSCFCEQRTLRKFSERKQWKRSDGYYEVCIPNTHKYSIMASKSRQTVLVHRLIMAEFLNRPLLSNEMVHHINGIKTDNRIENLALVTNNTHPLSYKDGYQRGLFDGLQLRDRELEKQIKLLQWQVKELAQQLQTKLSLFGV